MRYFGSSGVRMPWSPQLLEIARRLGCAVGSTFSEIVVGYDSRKTSQAITSEFVSGVLSSGCDVYLAGMVPTPLIAYASRNYDCGAVITASHNPPEYNGIKLWNRDGSSFSKKQCEEIEEIMERCNIVHWEKTGRLAEDNIVDEYIEDLLKDVGSSEAKVVSDPGNGASSYITPRVLSEMGCDVISLNSHPHGLFPGRPSEPSPENLENLRKMVISSNADIGVANDGDADRVIVITKKGKILSGDEILAILVKHFGFNEIVAPVDSSMLLEKLCKVHRSKVGDAFVSMLMKEIGVNFGGENSGTQIFAKRMYAPDGIYSAAVFAKIAEKEDLDSLVDSFPKFYIIRKSFRYKDREKLTRKIEKIFEGFEVNRADGWRIDLGDSWILIRFSGTEPKVRITVESEIEDRAKKVLEEVIDKIKEELL